MYTYQYDCIPNCGTFSRSPKAFGLPSDTYAVSGKGAYVTLNNNKSYLDWINGLGPNILGYNHTGFDHRVMMQLRMGSAFSLQSALEQEVGSKLVYLLGQHVPGWTVDDLGVRWGLSGSDVDTMAIRLARAITGKNHIIKIGYMGWHDWTTSTTPPALGIIPEESAYVHPFTFNDTQGITEWLEPPWENDSHLTRDDLAAIIIEQPSEEPTDGYYQFLHCVCKEMGALLIVDEVVTGFRYSLGGVSERYNIHPDLCTYGKALGNGIPVSALVGPKEYMNWWGYDSPPFCSSTFFGNGVSLAAAGAFLDIWEQKDIDYIWDIGQKFIDGMNTTGWKCVGHPPRSVMVFDNDFQRAWFIQALFSQNILMNRPNFINIKHNLADVNKTVKAAKVAFEMMPPQDELEELMKDKLPRILFRNR